VPRSGPHVAANLGHGPSPVIRNPKPIEPVSRGPFPFGGWRTKFARRAERTESTLRQTGYYDPIIVVRGSRFTLEVGRSRENGDRRCAEGRNDRGSAYGD